MGTYTIEFTCDSCKISKQIVMPYNMYVFSILPFILLWHFTYIYPLLSTFVYTIFYFMLYFCILYIYNDVLYMSFTSDIYIWDIYMNIKLADVIANIYCIILIYDRCYCQGLWLFLLCLVGRCYCLYCGRCEPHLNRYCLLSGKWNGHMLQQLAAVIDS